MKKKVLSILLTIVMLMGIFAPAGILTASAASVIEGTTGAGTEADPLIVDGYGELQAALAYDGTLYIVAKSFPTEKLKLLDNVETPFFEVVSKKVLTLKQNFDVESIGGKSRNLFSVTDGADFTMIADGRRKIKHTYTVLELAGPTAKATLKGELIIETTTDDGSQSSYALVAHQGNILIDGAYTSGDYLKISSASLKNNAAVFKNGIVDGKVALTGTAFRLYPGSVGFLRDEEQDFTTVPNFGAAEVVREDLRVACIGGFNEQSPALEGTDATITAAEEKVILGMSKKYSFKTTNNTGWAEKFVYTPTGTIQVVDSTNNLIYSDSDSDSGTFDKNVNLSLDIKDIIKTPGKYRIIEIIRLTRDGNDATKYVHIYPIEVVDFNTFLGQSPKMPAGQTEFFLGTISQASYPITFYSHSLPKSMVDEGYKSIAILKVYLNNADNTYVYGEKAYCDKGQKISYDLNELPAGIYKLVETIELRDKNNKVVRSAENTFAIDWTPQQDIKEVNITANWQGTISAPVCTTKGVKILSYRWEKYDGSNWNTCTGTIGGGRYRCMVELAAETGYKLASGYTVKIGGIAAKKYSGNLWYVARDITGYVNFVDIEHSNAPEAGVYPVFDGYDIVQGANTSVKLVEWYKCDKDGKKLSEPLTAEDMFEKDSYYRLEVTVAPATNYEFKNDASFYINGASVNYNTSHGSDIPGSITGYKVYHVDDVEGTFKLFLYGGNLSQSVIIKDGQYIASDSATPVTTKPSGGYAYYKNGVLTFEAYINTKAHFVFEEGNLDVYLKGRNVIGAIYNSEYLGEINGLDARRGNMTIDAAERGSLIIASNPLDAYCNIYVNTLTFNSGKVVSCLANGTYGSALYAEKLIIADGYKAYVGETNDFDASEEWNGTSDIKDYENVWLDKNVCRHNYVKYEKADATCTTEGVKETFEICEECYLIVKKENGEILTGDEATEFFFDVVIPKGDHTYQFVEKHDATCVSAGAKSSYWHCTGCNGKFVTDAKTEISLHEFSKNIRIPKLSHQLKAVAAKPAECEADGNIAYWVCEREECGRYYSDEAASNEIGTADIIIAKNGHTEEILPGKPATETETGLTEGKKCSVCDKVLVEQVEIPAIEAGHTHAYTVVVTDPTCKDKGFTTYTCVCGDSYIDSYTDVTENHVPEVVPGKAPTYEETGLTAGEKCSVCGKVLKEQEVIDKLPTDHSHEYTDTVVAPTCEDKGYTKHECICGDVIIDTYVDATGHTPEVIPGKAATETETGLTDGEKCSVCGTVTKEQTEIPKLEPGHTHSYTTVVTAPTCTEKGFTTYTCACGDTYKADETDATGHTPEVIPGKPATDTETGLTDGEKCSVCGKILKEQEEIPVLDKPIDYIPGDVNGDGEITASDARLALRISAGLDTPTEYQSLVADVNDDGEITASDARKILRKSAGLE